MTSVQERPRTSRAASGGTPEQVHLTWGRDPATSVSVSWAAPEAAVRPRVRLSGPGGSRVASAVRRTYTDGLSGELVYTYHAQLTGLRPDTAYSYAVTADNDAAPAPFRATFRTAPRGRASFRFTSFGDLSTPNPAWDLSCGQASRAVAAVESFRPLFHLLNGDLCYANLNPAQQPAVWRDFGANAQSSAAHRAWMPCPGNHEIEFGNGPEGLASYLTRYTLPDNGVPGFRGRWYSFRVGSALFVSLDADDVVYQDAGPLVAGRVPGARARLRDRGHPGGHLVLYPRLLAGGADGLAGADPGRGPGRHLDRLDHRADAPGRDVLIGRRERQRPGNPAGLAAAVRPLPGRPRAVRARPRLRAVVPGARLRPRWPAGTR